MEQNRFREGFEIGHGYSGRTTLAQHKGNALSVRTTPYSRLTDRHGTPVVTVEQLNCSWLLNLPIIVLVFFIEIIKIIRQKGVFFHFAIVHQKLSPLEYSIAQKQVSVARYQRFSTQ